MSKEQKDQPVTGNQDGKQNQGGQPKQDNQRKSGNSSENTSVVAEEEEDQPETPKEHPAKTQQKKAEPVADKKN